MHHHMTHFPTSREAKKNSTLCSLCSKVDLQPMIKGFWDLFEVLNEQNCFYVDSLYLVFGLIISRRTLSLRARLSKAVISIATDSTDRFKGDTLVAHD